MAEENRKPITAADNLETFIKWNGPDWEECDKLDRRIIQDYVITPCGVSVLNPAYNHLHCPAEMYKKCTAPKKAGGNR